MMLSISTNLITLCDQATRFANTESSCVGDNPTVPSQERPRDSPRREVSYRWASSSSFKGEIDVCRIYVLQQTRLHHGSREVSLGAVTGVQPQPETHQMHRERQSSSCYHGVEMPVQNLIHCTVSILCGSTGRAVEEMLGEGVFSLCGEIVRMRRDTQGIPLRTGVRTHGVELPFVDVSFGVCWFERLTPEEIRIPSLSSVERCSYSHMWKVLLRGNKSCSYVTT